MPDAGEVGRPALRVAHLSKTFPGTKALDDVTFDVRPGQIHALLGGNGSGKSTLIKILAGVYQGDAGGIITLGDTEIASDSMTPTRARALGLHFVHQNPAVFPALSVAENLAVGNGFETRGGKIRWSALNRRTEALLERFEINARPDTQVHTLRPVERAMVAIARALQDQEGDATGVLVLDEPTASLPRAEVLRLMLALGRYARNGQTILFVSHRLDEVIDAADEATVLRDGRLAGTLVGSEQITEHRLIELIAGRSLDRMFPEMPEVTSEELALEVQGLAGGPLHDVSFSLRRGEVLGIAGLLGSGRSEVLKMIFGAYPMKSGRVLVGGRPVRFRDIGDAMRAGIAYVPEDRGGEAAFPDMSVSENLSAAQVSRYWKGFRLHHRVADDDARASIGRFLIRTSSEQQELSTLSGGNQQKVILARWLRREPKILLLDEPTQGVDVNARAEIYALVSQAVSEGCSVVLVTSDFEELSRVSDRVVVLNQGRVTAEVRPPDIDPTRLTELAFSVREAS